MNSEELDDSNLQNEIEKIEYEMNAISPDGDIRNEFIEARNAENIKKLIMSLEVAHKLIKQHAKIHLIQHANITALYASQQKQKKILIGMGICIVGLAIKTIFF